jgi:hypothetical protein
MESKESILLRLALEPEDGSLVQPLFDLALIEALHFLENV